MFVHGEPTTPESREEYAGIESATCTCPDFELRQQCCKHIYAVEYTLKREQQPDGATVLTQTTRVTYRQDWPVYNAAQTHERGHFLELLHGL